MSGSRLVYSSSGDNTCSQCGKPLHKCKCKNTAENTSLDDIVRLQLERKGRGGKQVTVVSGLLKSSSNTKLLVKRLKSLCGTGGTTKGALIEIQGDHREKIKEHLENEGYKVKVSGG